MNETKFRIRVMVLLVLSISASGLLVFSYIQTASFAPYLKIHFLDVGQGDAIFIETPEGVQVLVDGGVGNSVLRMLAKEMSFFDRSIDMVIGTHPDSDHIGGLVDVLQRYQVGAILRTENTGISATWKAYIQAVSNEQAQVVYARQGQVFRLGAEVYLRVLYPQYDVSQIENNTSSIVVQLIYGDTSILLTGDSPKRIEEYLVAQGIDLKSTILKPGHHGSRTSTSEVFLDAVAPEYAVISAGKDNRYGHPHQEVMDLLQEHTIEIHNTAQEGTVTFISDGKKVWMNTL